jgi:hypothetical protein
LRHTPNAAVHASILPSWSRTAEQRDLIAEFQYRPEKLDRDEFKNLYIAASDCLEALDQEWGFRYDKLRIEVSGPTQPHLTLIVSQSFVLKKSRWLTRAVTGSTWIDPNDYRQTKPWSRGCHPRVDEVLLAEASDDCPCCRERHI